MTFAPIFHCSVWRVNIAVHNLTPLRRDDRNVVQVCVQHPFLGRTRRRSQVMILARLNTVYHVLCFVSFVVKFIRICYSGHLIRNIFAFL